MEKNPPKGFKNKNNIKNNNDTELNNQIIHYKEFLLNLEKEFSSNNDKLKKICSLKGQINEISNDIKILNSLEEQKGINDIKNYSSQAKSINNLSIIVNTLEKNYLKKQKINDKVISKISRKIKDILIYNKDILNYKKEKENNLKEKIEIENKIKEMKNLLPSLQTDLNMNKHKYSELLEDYEKVKKYNDTLNNNMCTDIINYGNQIKILEERKNKLVNVKNKQIDELKKKEEIDKLENELKKLKNDKDLAISENNEYEKLINDFLTYLNLNYINIINLKEQFSPLNKSEEDIEKYISNKNSRCQLKEQQIENILQKYY